MPGPQDVRADMSDTLDRIVPEAGPNGEALYRHDAEGMNSLISHQAPVPEVSQNFISRTR
jgi:thiamine phosphate synthase YjbQ (UPF0047 family)